MEGSIVRAIVRLDETCREFKDAAKIMGNTALVQQMEAASAAIKRDVIFAASLYVAWAWPAQQSHAPFCSADRVLLCRPCQPGLVKGIARSAVPAAVLPDAEQFWKRGSFKDAVFGFLQQQGA